MPGEDKRPWEAVREGMKIEERVEQAGCAG